MVRLLAISLLILLGVSSKPGVSLAESGASMSSDNFRLLDSQHAGFGGVASSSSGSFRLVAVIGDVAIGSSSATSFGLQAGFLTFMSTTTPTPTPTATPTATSTPAPGGTGGGGVALLPSISPMPFQSSDLNGDGRVDLVDFSILAFWWRRPIPLGSPYDLYPDGRVDLVDFSILAFRWTE